MMTNTLLAGRMEKFITHPFKKYQNYYQIMNTKIKELYICLLTIMKNLNNDFKYQEIGSNLIKMSAGIKLEVNEEKKILKFVQTGSSDWVLILGGNQVIGR